MQVPTRSSGSAAPHPDVAEIPSYDGDNLAFIADALKKFQPRRRTGRRIYIALFGSCDLLGASLRRAQAILRWDLRPSLWSHALAFVLPDASIPADLARIKTRSVPMDTRCDRLPEPAWNGITETDLGNYKDPHRDANVALLSIDLTAEESARVIDRFYTPNADRVRFNMWDSLCVWQTYFWSFGTQQNPLREGVPMPSSSFIEYCFDVIHMDLTPATSERTSAPELLWNTARFWHDANEARGHSIRGVYTLRDKGCTVLPPTGAPPGKEDERTPRRKRGGRRGSRG